MNFCSILMVDDDSTYSILVQKLLKNWRSAGQYRFAYAESASSARKILREMDFHIILLDLSLKGLTDAGFRILQELRIKGIDAEVIVMSSSNSFISVQKAMRLGANDYIAKGFDSHEFYYCLEKALERRRWRGMEKRLLVQSAKDLDRYRLVGGSQKMQILRDGIKKIAPSNVPVLIEAETGTGKELVARNLHLLSENPTSPFVALDCGTITHSMAESILFGHEKGAFTGADSMREGVFEEANGGTLFLDEITSLPIEMQNRFLRVLQEKEVRRLGGKQIIKVDFRLITAANKSLEKMVEQGLFKQDLFFRLNVLQLSIPPLRERREDLQELAEFFAGDKKISKELFQLIEGYAWPGNIRELKNLLQACVAMAANEPELSIHHLSDATIQRLRKNTLMEKDDAKISDWPTRLEKAVQSAEKEIFQEIYDLAHANISEVARLLGKDRSHTHKKLVEYGIHEPNARILRKDPSSI